MAFDDRLISHYYLDPATDRVPGILDDVIRSGLLGNFDIPQAYLPLAYFFGRVAQLDASLTAVYEEVVSNLPPEVGASGRVRDFADAIRQVAASDPNGPVNPMNRPASSPRDLDELWVEFSVTGDVAPIDRIMSVLDGDDLIRSRLQHWLEQPVSRSRLSSIFGSTPEKTRSRLAEYGIQLDLARREVTTPSDLDCLALLLRLPTQSGGLWYIGFAVSPELFEAVRRALPFQLTEAESAYAAFKASAKWSLASNATQHAPVREFCENPPHVHSERASLALTEITEMIKFGSPTEPVWYSRRG